ANAVKFTDKNGSITVLVRSTSERVAIEVVDTGIGIRQEFMPHVFDRFRQADPSTTRRHGGLGLGLAIVKQLVELHGGSIAARSAGHAQGATFTVSLPITVLQFETPQPDRRHPRAIAAPPSAAAHATLKGVKVLVVDD